MVEEKDPFYSSKLFKEATAFAWMKTSDKTFRIYGKTQEPV